MPSTYRMLILLCGTLCVGCESPKPAPPPGASAGARQMQVDYAEKGAIHFSGALEPDADREGFTWKVPGNVRLKASIPWQGEAPKSVSVKLEGQLEASNKQKTSFGSTTVKPTIKDGLLEFEAELTVMVPVKPTGATNVVVKTVDDQKEIVSLPTQIKFSK